MTFSLHYISPLRQWSRRYLHLVEVFEDPNSSFSWCLESSSTIRFPPRTSILSRMSVAASPQGGSTRVSWQTQLQGMPHFLAIPSGDIIPSYANVGSRALSSCEDFAPCIQHRFRTSRYAPTICGLTIPNALPFRLPLGDVE